MRSQDGYGEKVTPLNYLSPRVLGLGTAVPKFRYSQREIYDMSARVVPQYKHPRIEQIFMNSDIDYRHFSFDSSTFSPPETADQLHERFAQSSVPLALDAIRQCLTSANARVEEIDAIIAVTCTGYLCPGLSALIARELKAKSNLQRSDLVGMGCAGAMPGLQRAYEYTSTYPDRKALVVTVEICSACYYIDESLETVVGNAICADGAAAVLVGVGEPDSGPEILRFETLLDSRYIETVGFQFKAGKLSIVLSKDIRGVAGTLAAQVIGSMLTERGLDKKDIRFWVIHSGGRRVIDAIKESMVLTEEQLASSRCVLRNFGNMSSPTVLFVLQDAMKNGRPARGDLGVMLAMGPGLAVEGGLLRW